tara:strand:- start:5592 stop:5786 length:195 start_codon:yes stop_codon:yes gene_type:complete
MRVDMTPARDAASLSATSRDVDSSVLDMVDPICVDAEFGSLSTTRVLVVQRIPDRDRTPSVLPS